jgi:HAD superfamily hydrolase (TIGR01509 family)
MPSRFDWPGAVLFDFDGVIMDSEPLHLRAFQEVLADEGITLSDQEYYAELIGFDDRGAFQHLYQQRGRPFDAQTFARLINKKAAILRELIARGEYGPLPGAEQLIRALHASGYPLAICSGAMRMEIELMLEGAKLRACFPIIVSAEDVAVGKPDPSGYLQTMRLLAERSGRALAPAGCLVIEDAPIVIESVKRVGFRVLGVATTYSLEALSHADWAVGTLRLAEVQARIPQLKLAPANV